MKISIDQLWSFLALLVFVVSAFKCGVTVLRIRRQDLYMYWGRGNSLSNFIAHTLAFVWGTLALFTLIGFTAYLKIPASTEIQSSESITKNTTSAIPEVERPLTPEEIHQLEVKMQYSGDDEIIRKRLGLPPKSTQVTNTLPDQQPTLEKTPKVKADDSAQEIPKAESASE